MPTACCKASFLFDTKDDAGSASKKVRVPADARDVHPLRVEFMDDVGRWCVNGHWSHATTDSRDAFVDDLKSHLAVSGKGSYLYSWSEFDPKTEGPIAERDKASLAKYGK